jgi:hypothetical protein
MADKKGKKKPMSIKEFMKNLMKPISGKGSLATNKNTKKMLKKVDKS